MKQEVENSNATCTLSQNILGIDNQDLFHYTRRHGGKEREADIKKLTKYPGRVAGTAANKLSSTKPNS